VGHTLPRHVGKSVAELTAQLDRYPGLLEASSFADSRAAERAVQAAVVAAAELAAFVEQELGLARLNVTMPEPIGVVVRPGEPPLESPHVVVLVKARRAASSSARPTSPPTTTCWPLAIPSSHCFWRSTARTISTTTPTRQPRSWRADAGEVVRRADPCPALHRPPAGMTRLDTSQENADDMRPVPVHQLSVRADRGPPCIVVPRRSDPGRWSGPG